MREMVSMGIAAALLLVQPARAEDPGGERVLDERAYWRYYIQFGMDRFDTDALIREGENTLGETGWARLRNRVQRWGRPPFVDKGQEKDFTQVDWRVNAPCWITQIDNVACDDERISFHASTPPPPADWMTGPADPTWPRQRMPVLLGSIRRRWQMHGDRAMQQFLVRSGHFRTTFDVADPTAEYVLRLTYRGGARVFVNGVEVARGHLPAGELDRWQVLAAGYPKEAYVCLPGEAEDALRDKFARRAGSTFVFYCPDLIGRFEDASLDLREKPRYAPSFVNRKGWDRVTSLRDRTTGPVTIPARLLRKGANVLAIEVFAAGLHPIVVAHKDADWGRSYYMGWDFTWSHCRVLDVELRTHDGQAHPPLARPAGVQVWTEDMHRRMFATDFGPESNIPGGVKFVGGLNGIYSAQVVVGTDRPVRGLTASVSDLAAEKGSAVIPAAAVRVGYLRPHDVTRMVKLGQWRGLPEFLEDPLCPPAEMALLRHGPAEIASQALPHAKRLAALAGLKFFDHIVTAPPAEVPADSCQPVWLTLTVPSDAAEGRYRGAVKIRAAGIEPVTVPIEAEIFGCELPSPRRFQSVFAGEQSPYGVAKHYQAPLWSDEHFRLMESSFAQLGRAGSRWLFVPAIQFTEFGNLKDTPITWTRKADGSLGFDFGILQRYLDLAVKHLGPPEVICFVVAHGTDAGAKATVAVRDEKTGQTETLDLSSSSPHYRTHWQAFSTALHGFLKSRGLADSLYWGFGWDGIGDTDLIPLLGEFVPEATRWARGSHSFNRAPSGWAKAFTAYSCIYDLPITENSASGWRRNDLALLNPRAGSSVVSANGHSPPLPYRLLMNRALAAGVRGVARMGADYWDGAFYQGYTGRAWAGALPGIGCLSLLWPGEAGADSSQRFETFIEGIQEGEVRIFLEQALGRGRLPADLAERVRDILTDHHRQTLYLPPGRISVQVSEYYGGWQERSRRLYRVAGEVARAVALDVDRTELACDVPARGQAQVRLTLRNWTGRPRAWRAAADKPWIVPDRTAGSLAGHELLNVRLDAAGLTAGEPAEGTLTVTDAAGQSHAVKITARVGGAMHFVVPAAYDYLGQPGHATAFGPKRVEDSATFNVAPGGSETREFVFLNQSGASLRWTIASPLAWLKAAPASGVLPAGSRTLVKVTAAPPADIAGTFQASLAVREADGPARQDAKMVVHVIPPYAAPAAVPTGQAVPLSSLPKTMIAENRARAYWFGKSDPKEEGFGPVFQDGRHIHGGMPQRTVYDVAGAGFKAFSATVKLPAKDRQGNGNPSDRQVNFEVFVDGELRAQSGLMTAGDAPRLLVVTGLAGARQVKLQVRWDQPEGGHIADSVETLWLDPTFYK